MPRRRRSVRDRSITVILLSGSISPIRRLSLSPKGAWALAILSMAMIISLFCMGITLVTFRNDMRNIRSIKEDNQAKTEQLMTLQEQLRSLEKEKENIEREQSEIKRLMGIRTARPSSSATPSRSGIMLDRKSDPGNLASVMGREIERMLSSFNTTKIELTELRDQVLANREYYLARPNSWPVIGQITSTYGIRKSPFSRRTEQHSGLDIAANSGTPVRAAASGTVVCAGFDRVYGRLIKVDHGNSYVTWYGHNQVILVQVGEKVEKGQVIARVGCSGRSSGPHLHFAIQGKNGFVDPESYLAKTER